MIKRICRARWVCWQSNQVIKNICRPIDFFSMDQNLNTPKKTQKFTQNIFLLYNTHNFKISTWDAFSIASIMLQACLVTDQSKICIKLSLFISQINNKIRNLVVLILEKWPTLEFRRITPLVPVQFSFLRHQLPVKMTVEKNVKTRSDVNSKTKCWFWMILIR